jgi:hypothetical protein
MQRLKLGKSFSLVEASKLRLLVEKVAATASSKDDKNLNGFLLPDQGNQINGAYFQHWLFPSSGINESQTQNDFESDVGKEAERKKHNHLSIQKGVPFLVSIKVASPAPTPVFSSSTSFGSAADAVPPARVENIEVASPAPTPIFSSSTSFGNAADAVPPARVENIEVASPAPTPVFSSSTSVGNAADSVPPARVENIEVASPAPTPVFSSSTSVGNAADAVPPARVDIEPTKNGQVSPTTLSIANIPAPSCAGATATLASVDEISLLRTTAAPNILDNKHTSWNQKSGVQAVWPIEKPGVPALEDSAVRTGRDSSFD